MNQTVTVAQTMPVDDEPFTQMVGGGPRPEAFEHQVALAACLRSGCLTGANDTARTTSATFSWSANAALAELSHAISLDGAVFGCSMRCADFLWL